MTPVGNALCGVPRSGKRDRPCDCVSELTTRWTGGNSFQPSGARSCRPQAVGGQRRQQRLRSLMEGEYPYGDPPSYSGRRRLLRREICVDAGLRSATPRGRFGLRTVSHRQRLRPRLQVVSVKLRTLVFAVLKPVGSEWVGIAARETLDRSRADAASSIPAWGSDGFPS